MELATIVVQSDGHFSRDSERAMLRCEILCALELSGYVVRAQSITGLKRELGLSGYSNTQFRKALGLLVYKHKRLILRRIEDHTPDTRHTAGKFPVASERAADNNIAQDALVLSFRKIPVAESA